MTALCLAPLVLPSWEKKEENHPSCRHSSLCGTSREVSNFQRVIYHLRLSRHGFLTIGATVMESLKENPTSAVEAMNLLANISIHYKAI